MKFVLISRHTGNQEVPDNEKEQMMNDLGAWVGLLNAEVALPIRGGKSVTAKKVEEYAGDVGGVLIFDAESVEQAVSLASKSPGLKYGYTHDVFPEAPMGPSAEG